MPTSEAPVARAAASARAQASGGGVACRRSAPSATFVRHSPGAATRLIAPITWSSATTMRRSKPERGHELLDERPVRLVPRLAPAGCASRAASDSSSSQRSTPSPQLPNRGLTTTGGRSGEVGRSPVISRVRGCGKPGAAQQPGGEELVVRREQRRGTVQHRDAARLERSERPEAVVDAVERRQHVDPADRAVARAQRLERLGRASAATSRRRGNRPARGPRWRM